LLADEKRKREALPFLNSQAIKIEKIDKMISYHENKIKILEKTKQDELDIMHELFDTAVIGAHRLANGYTVAVSHSRKMKITNIRNFLLWLKTHCEPDEVMQFLEGSIKSTALKIFAQKQCDLQRGKGEINPVIDGIDFGDINFSRLTTFYKDIKK
jgi:hypothetical protein